VHTKDKRCLCDWRKLSTSQSPCSELGMAFRPRRTRSLSLYWLGFCFWDKFHWYAFHALLLSEWTVRSQTKAPTSWGASNCYSLAIHHNIMHFVNHQLVPARGGPLGMFITLDQRLSLFEQPKPLLNLYMAHCFIPKSLLNHIIGYWAWVPMFLAKLDADVLLNYLGHCQCTTYHNWFWLTKQSGREAIIHEWAQRYKVTCFTLLAPSTFLFERKKYGQIHCDQATYISVKLENCICRFKSAPGGAEGVPLYSFRHLDNYVSEQSHMIQTN